VEEVLDSETNEAILTLQLLGNLGLISSLKKLEVKVKKFAAGA